MIAPARGFRGDQVFGIHTSSSLGLQAAAAAPLRPPAPWLDSRAKCLILKADGIMATLNLEFWGASGYDLRNKR